MGNIQTLAIAVTNISMQLAKQYISFKTLRSTDAVSISSYKNTYTFLN